MQDSIAQHIETAGGIPESVTRMVALVIVTFALVILCVLLVFKMKEADDVSKPPHD